MKKPYDWNIAIVGYTKPINYQGYQTKKQAIAFMREWNLHHETKVKVIKRMEKGWINATID